MPQPRKLHDRYFKQAKAEGYVARSAYKLLEINDKFRIVRSGDRVLDLGCAPGSWMQVAAKTVGNKGLVVGVDLQPVGPNVAPGARTVQGDIFKVEPATLLDLSGSLFDVVLSDMAPSTTGHGDDFLSVRLCRRVLEILPPLLSPGGSLAMKVLEGEEFPELLREVRALFTRVKGFKPDSSRDVSREMFIVADGYRPPVPAKPLGSAS
ncbi:MAG: RlmE family RNA methyltransferase [Phycisphaerales bacterium]|nr:RlmE family RNA methyltransferase [Phycisphaerales bacterium]